METPQQPPHAAVEAPASPTFACAFPCIHCDYDLNAIPLSDPCPECGTPAAESLDSLAAVEPDDLRRAHLGILLLAIAGLGVPLLSLAVAIPLGLMIFNGGGEALPFLVGGLVLGVGPATALCGCFALSAQLRRRDVPNIERPQPAAQGGKTLQRFGLAHSLICVALGMSLIFAIGGHLEGVGSEFVTSTLAILALMAWDARNYFLCRGFAAMCLRWNAGGWRTTLLRWCAKVCFWLLIAHGLLALTTLAALLSRGFGVSAIADSHPKLFQSLSLVMMILQSIVQFVTLGWILAWPVLLAILYRLIGRALTCARANHGPLVHPRPAPDAAFCSAPPRATGPTSVV